MDCFTIAITNRKWNNIFFIQNYYKESLPKNNIYENESNPHNLHPQNHTLPRHPSHPNISTQPQRPRTTFSSLPTHYHHHHQNYNIILGATSSRTSPFCSFVVLMFPFVKPPVILKYMFSTTTKLHFFPTDSFAIAIKSLLKICAKIFPIHDAITTA